MRPPEAGALAGAAEAEDDWKELLPAEDAPFVWLLLLLAEPPAPLLLLLSPFAMRSAVDKRASTPGRGYK